MRVRITEGEQRNTMSVSQIKAEDSMVAGKVRNEVYDDFVPVNTKYDLNSVSYNRLKYTNPDMVPNCYSIIDNILARTEVEKIYNIWHNQPK